MSASDAQHVNNNGVTGTAVDVVIMAAGKGTRMKSRIPKVLQRLGDQALLGHVLQTAQSLGARSCVVVTGHQSDQVQSFVNEQSMPMPLHCVLQMPQLGTGHAVMQAVPLLADHGLTLILSGDVPLTRVETLQALIKKSEGQYMTLLTLEMDNPTGYGRVIRQQGSLPSKHEHTIQAIVEQKDANPEQLAIKEIYSGIMVIPTLLLKQCLLLLDNKNAQSEYYLTDIVKFAVQKGHTVMAHTIQDAQQVAGVNSPLQLAELERALQRQYAEALLEQGVRLRDPSRLDVRGRLVCGQDVEIDVNCVFEGQVELADGVRIGANCFIANAKIAAGAVIHPFTHIDGEKLGVEVGAGALVGPFARLRPGAKLGQEVHIGNFVEVKNSTLADGAKANHLAYLGDAEVGERVNYGAGSITANYDGANKHKTVIQADVHIGSNCVLVAPVTIGAGGTVGGGSTITKDTPPGALSVARGKQLSIANWSRPKKQAK